MRAAHIWWPACIAVSLGAGTAAAQGTPTQSGQAAYAAIGEIVRILDADSTTDWSRVNVEALRQHLIDMDEVTLQSHAVQRAVPGGVSMDVTGSVVTAAAIRRMVTNHGRMIGMAAGLQSSVTNITGGVRWVVTAPSPGDARAVARIRGLGFAGLMTVGEHHTAHHLAVARGDPDAHMH